MARFLVSFDGRKLDAAARERLRAAGGEFVAELELAADGATDTPGIGAAFSAPHEPAALSDQASPGSRISLSFDASLRESLIEVLKK